MLRSIFTFLFALLATSLPASAADYFAGKTIEFTVGADVGGGFDVYARTIAKHLPRHLPGNPIVVVKNMPGAGSGKAATYLATAAPKDGTAIGALMPGAVIGPLLEDREKPQYDPTKLVYLATADSVTRVCTSFITSKIKTFEDAQQQKGAMGASAAGGSSRDYVNLVRKAAGAQFDLVSGYKGSAEMALAIERGEVDGMCGWDWPSLKAQKPDWIRDNKVNILAQFSLEPDPELSKRGVPEIWQFIKKEEDREAGRARAQPAGVRPALYRPARHAAGGGEALARRLHRHDAGQGISGRGGKGQARGQRARRRQGAGGGESIYASAPAVVERAKELIRD